MDNIVRYLEAYMYFQNSVTHTLIERKYSVLYLKELLNLSDNAIRNRKKNPSLWNSIQLRILVQELKISDRPINDLSMLANHIKNLPQPQLKDLLKMANINIEKINLRERKPETWTNIDLVNILYASRQIMIKKY